MKVSIITVTYNSEKYIASCIESVLNQSYANIEYIIVDGASRDNTNTIIRSYGNRISKHISEPDKGIYDAMNKGIKMATGDIVGILNSDDFFPDRNIIAKIVSIFNEKEIDALYGDIAFIRPENTEKVVRYYSAKKFTPSRFKYGYMPPHPSFYAKRALFENYGMYKLGYKIAADYELLIRFLFRHKLRSVYLNDVIVYMRTGGVSNASVKSRYILNKEIVKACRENGITTNMFILSLKYFNKVSEYISPIFKSLGK